MKKQKLARCCKALHRICLALSAIFAVATIMSNVASAQKVSVVGVGSDRATAMRDASRNAVESVVGVYISSRTVMENYNLQDEVYTKSQGFVREIAVLSERQVGNSYEIQAMVDVASEPGSALMDRLNMITLLRNPRVSVLVGWHNGTPRHAKYEAICESVLNEKLHSLGFRHIIDSTKLKKCAAESVGKGGGDASDEIDLLAEVNKQSGDDLEKRNDGAVNVNAGNGSIATAGQQGGLNIGDVNVNIKGDVNVGIGRTGISIENSLFSYAEYLPNDITDYLVVGRLAITSRNVTLPKYSEMMKEETTGNVDTGIRRARAELDVSIIASDSGKVLGNFRSEAQAMHSQTDESELMAVKDAANKAAEKLHKMFNRAASDTDKGLSLRVRCENYDRISALLKRLEKLPGVRSVTLKGYSGGKGTIAVETDAAPRRLYELLKEKTDFGLFLENATDSTLEISLT